MHIALQNLDLTIFPTFITPCTWSPGVTTPFLTVPWIQCPFIPLCLCSCCFWALRWPHFHSSKTPLRCHFLGEVFVFQATCTCSIGFLGRFCLFLHHCLWPYRQKTKTTGSHFPLYHQRLKAGVVVRSHSLAGAPDSLRISTRFSLNPCGVERALGSTVKCWVMFYSLLFILLAFCILPRFQINHTKRFSLTY